ncbi:hypothetical protein AB5975_28150 [Pseudomonas putida]
MLTGIGVLLVALTGMHRGGAWRFISVQSNSVYTLLLQMKAHPAGKRKCSLKRYLSTHWLNVCGNNLPFIVSIRCLKNIFKNLFPKIIYSVYALNRQAVEPLATHQNKRRDTHAG